LREPLDDPGAGEPANHSDRRRDEAPQYL
jgi:hypothetical protein